MYKHKHDCKQNLFKYFGKSELNTPGHHMAFIFVFSYILQSQMWTGSYWNAISLSKYSYVYRYLLFTLQKDGVKKKTYVKWDYIHLHTSCELFFPQVLGFDSNLGSF